MFGEILGAVVRLVNVLPDTAEKILAESCGDSDLDPELKISSMPLRKLAESLEELDDL